MEDTYSIVRVNNIKCNSGAAHIVNNKKFIHINKSLSIPPTHKLHTNNNNQTINTPAAVTKFDHSTRALGMSLRKSVTNVKAAQPTKRTPVLSNADSGVTGNYIRLADVRVSAPAEQIAAAVADGNLLKSTHHGFLDMPGHGAMIAHVFPQLCGSLLSISKLVNLGLKVLYCSDFVTGFNKHDQPVFQGDRDVRTGL